MNCCDNQKIEKIQQIKKGFKNFFNLILFFIILINAINTKIGERNVENLIEIEIKEKIISKLKYFIIFIFLFVSKILMK